MKNEIETRLRWVNGALELADSSIPTLAIAASIRANAQSSYVFANQQLEKPELSELHGDLSKLALNSRYLAVLLGSSMFDYGGDFEYSGKHLGGSLFDIGLGWLPLALVFDCEVERSLHNAGFVGNLEADIAGLNCKLVVGSAAGSILALDDLKKLVLRKIEDTASCDPAVLVDYLLGVDATEWDYAVAETGFSFLDSEVV